mmetsp:Transcript_12586/g.29901  ORF Transcript_12586/g.29901 Transcript_12586/m.29901 type:complete len:244 (-) Transcript_12586:2667-3398(-)
MRGTHRDTEQGRDRPGGAAPCGIPTTKSSPAAAVVSPHVSPTRRGRGSRPPRSGSAALPRDRRRPGCGSGPRAAIGRPSRAARRTWRRGSCGCRRAWGSSSLGPWRRTATSAACRGASLSCGRGSNGPRAALSACPCCRPLRAARAHLRAQRWCWPLPLDQRRPEPGRPRLCPREGPRRPRPEDGEARSCSQTEPVYLFDGSAVMPGTQSCSGAPLAPKGSVTMRGPLNRPSAGSCCRRGWRC